jgi:nitroreductase
MSAYYHHGLEAARWAPSAHNSQPWMFRVGSDGVELDYFEARAPTASDPRRRHLLMGLGAAAEAFVFGEALVDRRIEVQPQAEYPVARLVSVSGMPESTDRVLSRHVTNRITARRPFLLDPVPASNLRVVEASCGPDVDLVLTDRRSVIDELAERTGKGLTRNFGDDLVFEEFARWVGPVRSDQDAGIPTASLQLGAVGSLLAWATFRPGVMRPTRRSGLHTVAGMRQRALARQAPVWGVLAARSDDQPDLFAAGRAMYRLWLTATSRGLRLHPMTAGLDHDDLAEGMARAVGLDPALPLVFAFRLGYGPSGMRTPRRPLGAIVDVATGEETGGECTQRPS